MKKLALVLCAFALAGCAHTSTEVSEPVACSTDCEGRYENIKAMATKFLGYTITHETKNSFTAQLVSTSPGYIVTSAMNVFRTPEQIFIDVETGGTSDTLLAVNMNNLTSQQDFRKIKVHKAMTSVQYETYTDNLFRIPH